MRLGSRLGPLDAACSCMCSQVTRTDVWHDPKVPKPCFQAAPSLELHGHQGHDRGVLMCGQEPAIISVAKFSPENYRPVGDLRYVTQTQGAELPWNGGRHSQYEVAPTA